RRRDAPPRARAVRPRRPRPRRLRRLPPRAGSSRRGLAAGDPRGHAAPRAPRARGLALRAQLVALVLLRPDREARRRDHQRRLGCVVPGDARPDGSRGLCRSPSGAAPAGGRARDGRGLSCRPRRRPRGRRGRSRRRPTNPLPAPRRVGAAGRPGARLRRRPRDDLASMGGRRARSGDRLRPPHVGGGARRAGATAPRLLRPLGIYGIPVQEQLLAWYRDQRRELPWRETTDPYAILVSEVMAQQTQVERVVPRWLCWLERWPTVEALAA